MSKTMSAEERDELRKNAPIPVGLKDYRNKMLRNIYNGVVIKVIGYEVTDNGILLWETDNDGVKKWMSPRDIEAHWDEMRVARLVEPFVLGGEEE